MLSTIYKQVESLPYKKCQILSASDDNMRFNGSSGGFVTSICHHLFDNEKIKSAICFEFNGENLFNPKIVLSKDDYIQTGSIYHDLSLINFIRTNIDKIISPVFITCLPCETRAIQKVLHNKGIKSIIISLVCSGQLTKQATYDFLDKHNLNAKDIESFSYRGKGWPSGINIRMKDGKHHFYHNVQSDWICFFHSTIYNLKKCFQCRNTYSREADFIIADPWFPQYIKNETLGCSVVAASTEANQEIIDVMLEQGKLNLHETIELETLIKSQFWTIAKKESYRKSKLIKLLIRVFRTEFYRKIFLKWNFRHIHYKRWMKILGKHKRKLYGKSRNH